MASLLIANLKILIRNRQALFWAIAFPLVFVTVFGLFDVGGPSSTTMAIIDHSNSKLSKTIKENLSNIEVFDLDTTYTTSDTAQTVLNSQSVDYLLIIDTIDTQKADDPSAPVLSLTLVRDMANISTNQTVEIVIRQFLDDLNIQIFDSPRPLRLDVKELQLRQVNYFDVLLMGLVGMGVMTNAIILIAVKISTYRTQQIFKRLLLTPLPVKKYFASEISIHLVLALAQAAIIMLVGVFVFGAHIYGNIFYIFVIVAIANVTFLNIGFIISGWCKTPAAASGLGNLIALPMMFFSGTFFPTSALPWFLPELMRVLPLTPMLEALRTVSLEGEPLWATWPQLCMLLGWVIVSSIGAIKLFRFK